MCTLADNSFVEWTEAPVCDGQLPIMCITTLYTLILYLQLLEHVSRTHVGILEYALLLVHENLNVIVQELDMKEICVSMEL